jgi:hypothetical protein
MPTSVERAVLRYHLHGFVLIAALVSQCVGAQPGPNSPPAGAQLASVTAEIAKQRLQPTLTKQVRDGRSASARGVVGSVSAAARCVEGYVATSTHRVTAQDVKIVTAERRECEGGRCRSYQVTAARDGTQPFDLEVSVTCS